MMTGGKISFQTGLQLYLLLLQSDLIEQKLALLQYVVFVDLDQPFHPFAIIANVTLVLAQQLFILILKLAILPIQFHMTLQKLVVILNTNYLLPRRGKPLEGLAERRREHRGLRCLVLPID